MANNNEPVKVVRGAYDDESYQRALVKLKLEELKAKKEKELLRQYRKRQVRLFLQKILRFISPVTNLIQLMIKKKWPAIATAVILITLISWGGWSYYQQQAAIGQSAILGTSAIRPNFSPLIPKINKPQVTTTQNGKAAIVAYYDTYKGVQLTISQQALPASFKSNPSAVEQLAKTQLNATESVTTSKGIFYYANNTTGQQWGVMQYQNVLLFMQANETLSSLGWAAYIGQLQVR